MESKDLALILMSIALIALVAVIVYLLYSFSKSKTSVVYSPPPIFTPTPTPTLIPTVPPILPPTTSPVTVTYTSPNGTTSSITLPQQAGVTITVAQGSSLLISGIANPSQVVTLYVFAPSGQLVYQQSTIASLNGQFSMIVPTTNIMSGATYMPTTYLSPGTTYTVTLSLGSNYYFYMTIG